jgi:hypothetical protein
MHVFPWYACNSDSFPLSMIVLSRNIHLFDQLHMVYILLHMLYVKHDCYCKLHVGSRLTEQGRVRKNTGELVMHVRGPHCMVVFHTLQHQAIVATPSMDSIKS